MRDDYMKKKRFQEKYAGGADNTTVAQSTANVQMIRVMQQMQTQRRFQAPAQVPFGVSLDSLYKPKSVLVRSHVNSSVI